ncbi:MAG: D-amino acid dehydrogenase [Saccharospirillum sp.]
MKITIIGAGIAGVSTAWALQRAGHDVRVVERKGRAAMETSYANAGQLAYGAIAPWASLATIRSGLKTLLKREGAMKLPLFPSLLTWHFMISMGRFAMKPALFEANWQAMLALGQYSRQALLALENDLSLGYDGHHHGMLKLASTEAEKTELMAVARMLERCDIRHQWLSPQQAWDTEPGMNPEAPLVGGLHLPGDGSGDCHKFTEALSQACIQAGVQFDYDAEVISLRTRTEALEAILLRQHGEEQWLESDAFVFCTGCASREFGLSLGLKLPIYPVKGYSITLPVTDAARAPLSALADDRYRLAITRLGSRVRVTGFAELADNNRTLPDKRLSVLRDGLEFRFPGAVDWSQAEPWAGFRPMTPDGPPAIGQGMQDNVWFNTGHGTWGWTMAAGSAALIAQQIAGSPTPFDTRPFDPVRFSRKGWFSG